MIYGTVEEYEKNHAKLGDRISFEGYGILDGLKNFRKSGTYKVHSFKDDGTMVFRAYRGRNNLILGANRYDQKVKVFSNQEFKELPIY